MSEPHYFISPDLLRELDALRAVLESQVLEDEEYGTMSSMKRFYTLKGFSEAMALVTNLTHGYVDTAEEVKGRLIAPDYEGMIIDLDDLEED